MINVPLKDGSSIVMDMAVYQASQGGSNTILDAGGALFFQRELEYVKAGSYDVEHADLPARVLFPVSNSAGPGAQTIVYVSYEGSGAAIIINNYSDDLPRVDVGGVETRLAVKPIGIAYGYGLDEIQAAQMAGQPLQQRKADMAVRSVEEKINKIAFFGDAATGLPGIFTNPNIPTGAVVDGGGGTEWINKTPLQVAFDVNELFSDIFETTLMKERGDTLLVPVAQWTYIMSTKLEAGTDTTIAQYVAANSPFLNSVEDIIPVNEMSSLFNGLGSDVMVAYNRSAAKLELEIPVELEMMAVQLKNLEFMVPGRARVAGLNIYYPLSLAIGTGI